MNKMTVEEMLTGGATDAAARALGNWRYEYTIQFMDNSAGLLLCADHPDDLELNPDERRRVSGPVVDAGWGEDGFEVMIMFRDGAEWGGELRLARVP